ncbi:MAG: replication initiator protein [Microviridae sp.]|nr:MAG: replication initiator protein [Microviridae sp.]
MHEKIMHDRSAFVTLTYDDKHLPPGGTLKKQELQLFMKRLRKRRPAGIRFFAAGEYGELTARPHYHLLLLNTDFPDMRFYKPARSGDDLYTSKELEELWPFGHSDIGNVTFNSCAYVARYVVKKITGDKAAAHYAGRDPEFVLMSRRPGIGLTWYIAHGRDAYRHDTTICNGKEQNLPRYYDGKYEAFNPKRLAQLKSLRKRRALLQKHDNNSRRRYVKEMVATAKLNLRKRSEQ